MSPWPDPVTDLNPAERVLFLGAPGVTELRTIAASLSAGLVVVLGNDEEVRSGRQELQDLFNVMFVPAPPDEIPWQDGFFDRVVDTKQGGWADPERFSGEVRRVLKRA